MTTVLLIGAAQGMVLAFILLGISKGNKKANRLLAAALIIFSITIAVHALSHAESVLHVPHHHVILGLLFFLLGPAIYFYVLTIADSTFEFKKPHIKHLSPFLVFFLLFLAIILFNDIVMLHIFERIMTWILIVHLLGYLLFATKKLRWINQHVQDVCSHLSPGTLRWLMFFLVGFIIIWSFAVFLEAYTVQDDAIEILWVFVSIFMYAIGYFALCQPEVIYGTEYREAIRSMTKYKKSTLTAQMSRNYHEKLILLMESEKPYLKSRITLPQLAIDLAISTNHLSQIINAELHKNFYDFINDYRVEEAKRLIADEKYRNINLATIGLDSGFQSISSFNSIFKKKTGLTPSQYRENVLNNL